MKKKIISTLLVAAVMATTFAGCSGGTSVTEKTTTEETNKKQETENKTEAVSKEEISETSDDDVKLTWAVFETDNYTAEVWQTIIDAFEKDNPGIKIEKVLMTGDSRPQFLKTMLAAGNMPDINIDPVDLASTEGIYAEVPEELLQKYEDTAIATYGGKHTLVPAYKALRNQCYYHKDQFEEAGITEEPQTWEEFLEVCKKLKESGKTPLMGVGASDIWATSFGWWTGVANADIMNAYPDFNADILNGKLEWTDSVVADSLNAWKTLIDEGYYHKGSMSFSYTQASEEFAGGSAAMFMDGAWSAAGYDGKGLTLDDMGVFVMPTPTGAKNYCTMPQYWGVSETCQNKEAAFKFCEYVLGGNPEIYKYYLKADGTYSVTNDPVEYEMGPIQTKFADNYKEYKLVPEIMKMVGDTAMPNGFEDFTCKSLQNIFTGADVESELATWGVEMERLKNANQ
ncbi:ABC transporter substrate-binding protein [uncultured Robinsoniella sp.]|uniref:ABC transporter substrate-binding protein n=1 Tax=uncultured Robinsoniella sp. TaxID=904190 RepID=UPI00374E8726